MYSHFTWAVQTCPTSFSMCWLFSTHFFFSPYTSFICLTTTQQSIFLSVNHLSIYVRVLESTSFIFVFIQLLNFIASLQFYYVLFLYYSLKNLSYHCISQFFLSSFYTLPFILFFFYTHSQIHFSHSQSVHKCIHFKH